MLLDVADLVIAEVLEADEGVVSTSVVNVLINSCHVSEKWNKVPVTNQATISIAKAIAVFDPSTSAAGFAHVGSASPSCTRRPSSGTLIQPGRWLSS